MSEHIGGFDMMKFVVPASDQVPFVPYHRWFHLNVLLHNGPLKLHHLLCQNPGPENSLLDD